MTVQQIVSDFVRSKCRAAIPPGELTTDTPLFSSGAIDSFGILELVAFLEDQFNVTIDPARHDMHEFDTIDRIVHIVTAARPPGP